MEGAAGPMLRGPRGSGPALGLLPIPVNAARRGQQRINVKRKRPP